MMDLIERQAAIDAFFMELCFNKEREYAIGYKGIEKIINKLPSAEKTGRWVSLEKEIGLYECSRCGHKILRAECNYCPNCGALMRGEEDAN